MIDKKTINILVTRQDTPAGYKESINTLAQNIIYSFPKDTGRKIMFSATDKTADAGIIAANTAFCLAEAGYKVLLIDCNFQDSKVTAQLMPDGVKRGFSDIICELCKPSQAINKINGIDFIGLGKFSPNSQKLLNAEKINQKFAEIFESYDWIIFCVTAANSASGAPVFASMCDGVLLVARERKSRMIDIRRSCDYIRYVGGFIIGLVLENSRHAVKIEA